MAMKEGGTTEVRDLVARLPLRLVGKCRIQYVYAGENGNTYVCFRWRVVRFVLTLLYWPYLLLTSLSMLTASWEAGGQ